MPRCDADVSASWPPWLLLAITFVPTQGQAGVRNIRFVDTDATVGTLGGDVLWDRPLVGYDDILSYTVSLSTDGATAGAFLGRVLAGQYTSQLSIAGVSLGSNTHIVVSEHRSTGDSNLRSACFIDQPPGSVRTVYATTVGWTAADAAKSDLISSCAANYYDIQISMVATLAAVAGGGSINISQTAFDDATEQSETAVYLLVFQTGKSFSDVEGVLTTHTSSSPVPAVHTGTGADTNYALATQSAYSSYDNFVPSRSDPDIGIQFAYSCIKFLAASHAFVTREGDVRLFTKTAPQSAITSISDIFFGYSPTTYEVMGLATGLQASIDAQATATSSQPAVCWPADTSAAQACNEQ